MTYLSQKLDRMYSITHFPEVLGHIWFFIAFTGIIQKSIFYCLIFYFGLDALIFAGAFCYGVYKGWKR